MWRGSSRAAPLAFGVALLVTLLSETLFGCCLAASDDHARNNAASWLRRSNGQSGFLAAN